MRQAGHKPGRKEMNMENNGFKISCFYAGIDTYVIEKDGKEIATCWALSDVLRVTGLTVEEINKLLEG